MIFVVLADTHARMDLATRLSHTLVSAITAADMVLHAGDITTAVVLDELRAMAEVHAVLGNNDGELAGLLPESLLLEIDGVRVGMVHDAGRRERRGDRLRQRFPTAQVVVFGHSHIPCDEVGVAGQLLFNPGSPTQRRAQPVATFGVLEMRSGVVLRHEIVPV